MIASLRERPFLSPLAPTGGPAQAPRPFSLTPTSNPVYVPAVGPRWPMGKRPAGPHWSPPDPRGGDGGLLP